MLTAGVSASVGSKAIGQAFGRIARNGNCISLYDNDRALQGLATPKPL